MKAILLGGVVTGVTEVTIKFTKLTAPFVFDSTLALNLY